MQVKKTVLVMNHDGKCFEHSCALSELYCKNNCALINIINIQLFCNCHLHHTVLLTVFGDRYIEKARTRRAMEVLNTVSSAQLFPPITMKNMAAKNATRTMRQIVRNGTFDAKVFLMLRDRGLFSYGNIGCRNCRLNKPA